MTRECEAIADQVLNADGYADIFGSPEHSGVTADDIQRTYRRLSRLVHPDICASTDPTKATEAFRRLTALRDRAHAALTKSPSTSGTRVSMRSRQYRHDIGDLLVKGAVGRIYEATSSLAGSDTEQASVLKIATSPRDNDLLEQERRALKILRGGTDDTFHPYIPALLDSFRHRDDGNAHTANVISRLDGFYTLEDVRRIYSRGVHPLDMAWMWRRLLVAVGYAHQSGIVHGAVLPDNVMVHPELHGLVLIDWCYSREVDEHGAIAPVKLVQPAYRHWYPNEVTAKQPPDPSTDIYLAARTTVYLLGGDAANKTMPTTVPRNIRAFLRGCMLENQRKRPQDAWGLLNEFDELLERLGEPYYPRRFRTFTMP